MQMVDFTTAESGYLSNVTVAPSADMLVSVDTFPFTVYPVCANEYKHMPTRNAVKKHRNKPFIKYSDQ